jgi:hypothetical protein
MRQVGDESDQYDFSGLTECSHSNGYVRRMSVENKKAWVIVAEFGPKFRNTWQETILKSINQEKLRDKRLWS